MKHVLAGAIEEIRSLRRQNEILRAKVEVMDLFALTLNTTPNYRSTGMAPDIAWELQHEIDKLDKQPPTVGSLDALLNSEDDTPVEILANGDVKSL
jgi:hypothetical protein